MGVQCIFCPKALFSRNVKQDFSVQEPEYSRMGFFIFSSYSAEIWLSHENVSQYCWELLHRAKERWSLHYTTPLNPRRITVYSFHYKALLHPATEINLIFSSEVKVALNEITSSAREKKPREYIYRRFAQEQNMASGSYNNWDEAKMTGVSVLFLHWPWEEDRDQKVWGPCQNQVWFLW